MSLWFYFIFAKKARERLFFVGARSRIRFLWERTSRAHSWSTPTQSALHGGEGALGHNPHPNWVYPKFVPTNP